MINDEIRRLRQAKGMSRPQLAEALNVSLPTIVAWESGARRPDYDMLLTLARYFNVSLDTLCGLTPVEDDESRRLWEYREKCRRDPVRRILFSVAGDGKLKDVKRAVAVIDALKAADVYDGDDPA